MSIHSNHLIHSMMMGFGGFVSPEWLASSEDDDEGVDRVLMELPAMYSLTRPHRKEPGVNRCCELNLDPLIQRFSLWSKATCLLDKNVNGNTMKLANTSLGNGLKRRDILLTCDSAVGCGIRD